jgi:hypothetical protein
MQDSIGNGHIINDVFKTGLFSDLDTAVPVKVMQPKPLHEPYCIINTARRACNKQGKLCSKFQQTNNTSTLARYKELRRANIIKL